MNEAIFAQVQKEMDESVGALRKELAKLRTGRASTALLEHIVVEYYGATTPLNQLATLSAPEARLLVIQPYDRSAMVNIEKALLKLCQILLNALSDVVTQHEESSKVEANTSSDAAQCFNILAVPGSAEIRKESSAY